MFVRIELIPSVAFYAIPLTFTNDSVDFRHTVLANAGDALVLRQPDTRFVTGARDGQCLPDLRGAAQKAIVHR